MKSDDLETILPPPPEAKVYLLGAMGAGLSGLALALRLAAGDEPGLLLTLRLWLILIGCITAGAAISWNSKLFLAWLIACLGFVAARFAMPKHWDSAGTVVLVGAIVTGLGTVLTAAPRTIRRTLLSILALVHFGAIYCATTWPEPAPWTTQQIGSRIYWPYMKFMYLSNAYHFYSPEPGPASLIFALVTYEKPLDDKGGKAVWYTLPTRHEHYRDPLGLTYYRRLSITEQLAQTVPASNLSAENWQTLREIRNRAAHLGDANTRSKIPWAPNEFESQFMQYRPLRLDIAKHVLPDFADYILKHYSRPDNPAVSVKIYRLEHRVLPAIFFGNQKWGEIYGNKSDPYHPTTYRPYYLGEFVPGKTAGTAELKDPQDPLLYWLVPILPNFKATPDYVDYMSEHAGFKYDWEHRKP